MTAHHSSSAHSPGAASPSAEPSGGGIQDAVDGPMAPVDAEASSGGTGSAVPAQAYSWDPLAAQRTDSEPHLDVILAGTVFFDLVFTGLSRMPQPGEELWATGMGSSPGGIANLAVAATRLGLRTGLVAGFGDDAYADWLWRTMNEEEGIDLSASRRFANFHTSMTASIAAQGDRAMVTHGHELPVPLSVMIGDAPVARAAVVDLGGETDWWSRLAANGTRIFADIGFDPTDRWDVADLAPLAHCYAFTPNALEAMSYTRTESPNRAVRALADRVPLAVVTNGTDGAYAIDSSTGEEAYCPAVPVHALDTTGAGDVFAAALVLGTLADWSLEERLKFASLSSGLAVQQFGGSLAAPGWGDLMDWWLRLTRAADDGDLRAAYTLNRYHFLERLMPTRPVQGRRRAQGTFALHSDAGH